ncbi:hypothetical protein JCM10908_000234 [Rhodotorula pacifica]|uniref:phosphatidylinositol-3-phosphatase YMR1 n=1 Tax=Rhodotorula pacifica TaxID=1495444 RepID=UPI00317DCDDE
MDALKTTTVRSVQLTQRHGSAKTTDTPLCRPTTGSLHLTTHHAIFEVDSAPGPNPANGEDAETASGSVAKTAKSEKEVWIPLSLLHSVTRSPPSLTGDPSPILLRTRLFESFELAFASLADADNVWDSLKGLCSSFSSGGLENRYAFFCGTAQVEDKKGKGKAGWDIYDPAAEFARMGLGKRSKAWRTTSLNADFQFCPSYPAEIVVPAKISDTTLSYAVKYRSKSRIPGLVYLHWANLGSITRSSQPMVGITQNARSIQDEKLVEAIFASHGQHSHKLSPNPSSDGSAGPPTAASQTTPEFVYGSTATNVIIDARPTKNAYANSVKGAGTENMSFYKNCRKEYLGIDNIHVMRASLNGIFDALADAEATGSLDRAALRRTHWLSHLTNILEGVLIVVRTIHLSNSHVLVHCSDGWDRTSQLSALPQICLDPYFRTARGLAVLIEKDWISYGHRFADRSGHLCDDRVEFVQKLGTDASTQQAFLASVTRQFASSSHAFKEACPVFQQFLDCIYQLQRQYPSRFEWNETLLRHLVRETYEGSSGSFLFNSEKERADLGARTRTSSVWESVFDLDDGGNLSLKPEFRNEQYNPSLDDPNSKAVDADLGVLLFDPQDVKWWYQLFGRTDDEMNAKPFANDVVPGAPISPEPLTTTEHTVVESAAEDPVTNGLVARASSLVLSGSTSPPPTAASPSRSSLSLPPTARSPSPSANSQADRLASVQKLGWSAWKSVRKFGEDAARQLKEQQQAAAARAAADAELAGAQNGGGPGGASTSSAASDDWASRATQFGGGMWSKLSAGNPWLAEEAPVRTSSTSNHALQQSAGNAVPPPPREFDSLSTAPPAPQPPPLRHPSSALSINPWETISKEEAIASSPSVASSQTSPPSAGRNGMKTAPQPPLPPLPVERFDVQPSSHSQSANGTGGDPLGVLGTA